MSDSEPMTDAGDIELDEESAEPEPLLPNGTVVDDKYTILRALGRGGTGTVYEAQHAVIGHRIALKIVNTERAKRPETLARFQREAKMCGTIRHPNVGQIYDVGMYDGKPYMILELHEGQSLGDLLNESVLPIPAVIEIALQVLSALGAIHGADVVHRDVKPDNAMLVRSLSGDIVVKLVDFGISKLMTVDIRERTLTREGSIVGSPDYMAPEQLRGQEVDARTDLYAVGVLLYEAVTGATPFDAENLSDLMAAILRDPVIPPHQLRGDCPEELEALILKALSREPEQRFQSALEMTRELERVRSEMHYVPDPGITGLRRTLPPRAERVTRARRMPQAAAAAVAAAAVAPAPSKTQEIVAPRASQQSKLVYGIAALLLAAIAMFVVLDMRGIDAAPAHVVVPAQSAPPSAPPVARVEPVAAAAPHTAVAEERPEPRPRAAPSAKRERRPSSKAAEPEPELEPEPEPESKPEPEPEPEPSLQDQLAEASSAFVLGQMPRAKALYQQIITRAPRQPDAWRGLGLVAGRMGQRKDAERAFERYLELRPNAPDAARIREQLERVR